MSALKSFNKVLLKWFSITIAALSLVFVLTACAMGLGDPIDWEPPVLTLVPMVPNPYYVRLGTKLTGTVSDNESVDRVIMRDSVTGELLFTTVLSEGKWEDGRNNYTWEIEMTFTEDQNGEKIAAEIIAYDKYGNTGDASVAVVTLIVDIKEPVIDDIWIQRTSLRRADLEDYNVLKALEDSDPRGDKKANVDIYQNGNFNINAFISEDETRIEPDRLTLNLYEYDEPNEPLYTVEKEANSSTFSPRWLIEEAKILEAGDIRHGNYTARYDNGERFYFRIQIVAYDKSENQSGGLPQNFVEEQGYIVMWKTADNPKGIVDPIVAGGAAEGSTILVTKGSTLPVEFFDDDSIAWAYAGLLTEDQWNGVNPVATGVFIPHNENIPNNENNENKLSFLREQLREGNKIYNWRFDKHGDTSELSAEIVNQAPNGGLDEKIYYVQTGNSDSDNGEFVLFTLVGDHKLDPHPDGTSLDIHTCRVNKVSVVDENAPLIVFDVDNGSPEENTFPSLTDGRYFTIKGYTLRAINNVDVKLDEKRVIRFRMAWIPYYINDRQPVPDELIPAVQAQLANEAPSFTGDLAGVQWWEFTDGINFGNSVNVEGELELIGTNPFRKQNFSKKFDILGGDKAKGIALAGTNGITLDNEVGDISNESHFVYNNKLENETKLFVFYAEDNMGHQVYRQIRLLGNTKPPTIGVYDITTKNGINLPSSPVLPNLNNDNPNYDPQPGHNGGVYFNAQGIIDDTGRALYRAHLLEYQPYGYNAMRPVALNNDGSLNLEDGDRTEPYQAYPRDTEIKYWVMAEKSGDLAVGIIRMQDITFSTEIPIYVGEYNDADRSLSYIEMLPEVTQRVFLFTATDTLGNEARIQRTVAVTNAAVLNNITTTSQTGSYGIGQTITLQANFSNLVYWTGSNPPKLNVRYNTGGDSGSPVVTQIETKTPRGEPRLFLEFDFTVQEGFTGTLETMYSGMPEGDDRPITLPSGTKIIDNARGDEAFTPKNSLGFDWTATGQGPRNSLQGSKTITLKGVRPLITGLSLTNIPAGKEEYADGYYFKADETIEFTLMANSPIFTSGDPEIGLLLEGDWRTAKWVRSSNGSNGMVFSIVVNNDTSQPQSGMPDTRTPDGMVNAIRLNNVSAIVDNVGNAFLAGSAPLPISTISPYPGIDYTVPIIHIDKTPPTAPLTYLSGTSTTTAAGTYNSSPYLEITRTNDGSGTAPVKTEYSLDNGVTWEVFTSTITQPPQPNVIAKAGWTSVRDDNSLNILNGEWILQTRFTDRAGNIGAVTSKAISINAKFPELKSITVTQPKGTFIQNNTLTFNLSFENAVYATTANPTNVITLTNRRQTNSNNTDGTDPSYQIVLSATGLPTTAATAVTSFSIAWNNIAGKEMLNGLYVSAVDFAGLRDIYGNSGISGTASASGTAAPPSVNDVTTLTITNPGAQGGGNYTYTCPNLAAGYIVDCIAPKVITYSPATTAVSNNNKTITLTFSEPVDAAIGTITIKPHGQYLIPPVFENEGYYLDTDGTKYTSPGTDRTYVDGMSDIFNRTTTNEQKHTLIGWDDGNDTAPDTAISISAPPTNARSGQTLGPYIRMTHGLKEGVGYTGDYSGDGNGPFYTAADSQDASYMIPDTTTKWVLDYRYSIHNTDGTNTYYTPATDGNPTPVMPNDNVVPTIRDVLTAVKWRWQEIDVTSGSVRISGSVVTITLPEPLLKGLQWDLCYPAGTFTDKAGTNAPALNYSDNTIVGQEDDDSNYWFWSSGAQTPVIRVNRKSYDNRTSGWQGTGRTSAEPTAREANYPSAGWNINDFSRVHYRIESESPGAEILYSTIGEQASDTSTRSIAVVYDDSATASWDIAVPGGVTFGTGNTAGRWTYDGRGTTAAGTWVRPNLIRRTSGSTTVGSYSVYENGVQISRNFQNNHQGFRSHNADLLKSEITSTTPATSVTSGETQYFEYYPTEASKRYVVATATVNGSTSDKGYEGVFRSVVAIRKNTAAVFAVEGSNIKNGMPSIAGFPVRDAEETGDNRYIKLFYNSSGTQKLWVSTEIVSQWYLLTWGGGGTHQNTGDVNNYLYSGYGDLTFGYNVGN